MKEQAQTKMIDGRYRADLKPIGKGISSTVMSGINMETGKKVAIKHITCFNDNKYEALRILR